LVLWSGCGLLGLVAAAIISASALPPVNRIKTKSGFHPSSAFLRRRTGPSSAPVLRRTGGVSG
jgi:hypothetical protein